MIPQQTCPAGCGDLVLITESKVTGLTLLLNPDLVQSGPWVIAGDGTARPKQYPTAGYQVHECEGQSLTGPGGIFGEATR